MRDNIDTLVETLRLQRHPEGGWFRETWRASTMVTLPGWPGPRATATGILYLLRAGESSRWHRVRGDELWLWHRGGPLLLTLGGSGAAPGSDATPLILGADVEHGQLPQALVPGSHWQCARPAAGQEVLVSCVVSPGFHFADFELLPDTENGPG
ncbi:MAG TPA: cupin domain-containing protein [Pseudonocardiaceae bacterium]|nr:cupin domain-containing protein [Pseudonocardiaceae bacterium]